MNKILIAPIMILLVIVVMNMTFYNLEEPNLTEDIILNENGWFVTNSVGQTAWFNNNTGNYYQCWTSGNDGETPNLNINASEENNTAFKLFNTDSGEWEYYENLEDFELIYGSAGIVKGSDNLLDTNIFWGILALALGIGIAVGVTVIGTGISDFAQKLVFTSAVWGGVWLFLTAGSYDILINDTLGIFGTFIYIALTVSFIIGVIMTISEGE